MTIITPASFEAASEEMVLSPEVTLQTSATVLPKHGQRMPSVCSAGFSVVHCLSDMGEALPPSAVSEAASTDLFDLATFKMAGEAAPSTSAPVLPMHIRAVHVHQHPSPLSNNSSETCYPCCPTEATVTPPTTSCESASEDTAPFKRAAQS